LIQERRRQAKYCQYNTHVLDIIYNLSVSGGYWFFKEVLGFALLLNLVLDGSLLIMAGKNPDSINTRVQFNICKFGAINRSKCRQACIPSHSSLQGPSLNIHELNYA